MFWPGVPAGLPKADKVVLLAGQGEVIAREEDLVAVEEDSMALGMAGYRDDFQVWAEIKGTNAIELLFDAAGAFVNFLLVEDAIATKMLMELLMVSHIIAVS